MTVSQGEPIVLDFDALVSNEDLSSFIQNAFGKDGLGVCIVKNVPNLRTLRKRLLLLASQFANLSENVKNKYEHPESKYSFGWSHGKEVMNGKPDFAKGSFYANPIHDIPPSSKDHEYSKKHLFYSGPNV